MKIGIIKCFHRIFFSFGLLIDVPDLEVCLREDVLREVVHVSLVVDNFSDAGIDENLGT